MYLSEADKIRIVKAFTDIQKSMKGKGPKNIILKNMTPDIHIISDGIVTEFERYIFERFGYLEIKHLFTLQENDRDYFEKQFLDRVHYEYPFKIDEIRMNYEHDQMTIVLKEHHITCNKIINES